VRSRGWDVTFARSCDGEVYTRHSVTEGGQAIQEFEPTFLFCFVFFCFGCFFHSAGLTTGQELVQLYKLFGLLVSRSSVRQSSLSHTDSSGLIRHERLKKTKYP
jgi:hypothetical protein